MTHEHRFNLAQIKKEFVPIESADGENVYGLIEWGYMVCNCGYVKRTLIDLEVEGEE